MQRFTKGQWDTKTQFETTEQERQIAPLDHEDIYSNLGIVTYAHIQDDGHHRFTIDRTDNTDTHPVKGHTEAIQTEHTPPHPTSEHNIHPPHPSGRNDPPFPSERGDSGATSCDDTFGPRIQNSTLPIREGRQRSNSL